MLDRDLPLKQEIANNIRKLMKDRGWKQIDLSEKSGISKSTLSDYLNCKTLINLGNVQKLAEAFGVSKAIIDPSFNADRRGTDQYGATMERGGESFSFKTVTSLPIVGTISCGNGTLAYEDIEGYKEVPSNWISGGEYFFLRAKGDSMINARIENGDLLLIRKQLEFENGEIMAVLIEDEAFLKRIYRTDGSLFLQSENPKYRPIIVREGSNIRIIGKLKMNLIEY